MKAKEKIGPVPFVLIAAAMALIVAGDARRRAQLVLAKAVNICMGVSELGVKDRKRKGGS